MLHHQGLLKNVDFGIKLTPCYNMSGVVTQNCKMWTRRENSGAIDVQKEDTMQTCAMSRPFFYCLLLPERSRSRALCVEICPRQWVSFPAQTPAAHPESRLVQSRQAPGGSRLPCENTGANAV